MDDTITTIYCLCDDFLKAIRHRRRDDPQTRLSTAEVMTVPLVASTFFGGEIEKTHRFLHEFGYMPKMLSKSHLNRRLHAIEPTLWRVLFELLAQAFKKRETTPNFRHTRWTLYRCRCATTSVSAAAEFTLRTRAAAVAPLRRKSRSGATLQANGATSMACACIWW